VVRGEPGVRQRGSDNRIETVKRNEEPGLGNQQIFGQATVVADATADGSDPFGAVVLPSGQAANTPVVSQLIG
jgi:hypothetical protein